MFECFLKVVFASSIVLAIVQTLVLCGGSIVILTSLLTEAFRRQEQNDA